jgi:hypothetical protein
LLTQAGFTSVDLFCPWPRYQNPDFVVRCGDEPGFAYFRRVHLRRRNRLEAAAFGLLQSVGAQWTFAPAWIALARRK